MQRGIGEPGPQVEEGHLSCGKLLSKQMEQVILLILRDYFPLSTYCIYTGGEFDTQMPEGRDRILNKTRHTPHLSVTPDPNPYLGFVA